MNTKKLISPSLILISILSISFICNTRDRNNHKIVSSKELAQDTVTLTAIWTKFACDCPRWIDYQEYPKYLSVEEVNCDSSRTCFEVEPTDSEVKMPDSLFRSNQVVVALQGRFYLEKQFIEGNDGVFRANLFQYDSFSIVTERID